MMDKNGLSLGNKPLRILHVLASLDRAGAETMLMNLYRNIDKTKVQFDFAISKLEESDYEKECLELGSKIYRYPRYKVYNHNEYKKWWKDFFEKHDEYKIIHGHIGSTAAIYLNIGKNYERYTIAHSHSIKSKNGLFSVVYNMYSFKTRYVANFFFGCSKEAIYSRYGNKVASNTMKAKVLNNAIEVSKFIFNENIRITMRKELGILMDKFVVGTIGRITKPKNPHKIINIVKDLKKRNVKFRFLWVGIGDMKEEIEKIIVREKLEDTIILLGLRNDVEKILQAMDVFILPSLWEGLGVVNIEAQASGLPTLCSDKVPIEAKVTNLCHFIKLDDTNLWVDSIIKYRNIERRNTYKEIVSSGYDIKDTSKWLENFYCSQI